MEWHSHSPFQKLLEPSGETASLQYSFTNQWSNYFLRPIRCFPSRNAEIFYMISKCFGHREKKDVNFLTSNPTVSWALRIAATSGLYDVIRTCLCASEVGHFRSTQNTPLIELFCQKSKINFFWFPYEPDVQIVLRIYPECQIFIIFLTDSSFEVSSPRYEWSCDPYFGKKSLENR